MPGFSFGAPSATSTPVCGGGTLFASTVAAKPLFGTASSTTSTTQATSLFGVSAPTTTTTVNLFGASPAKPAASTGSMFGSTATTTSTSATGTLFGSTTSKSFFGTTSTPSSTTTAGGLFGKPTTGGLFGATTATSSAPTAAGGGIFGSAATSIAPTGLGGTGSFMLGSTTTGTTTSNAVGVTGAAASTNPMDGEVPKPLLDLIAQLKERIKKNRELSDEFVMNSNDTCVAMNEKLDDLKRLIVEESSDMRRSRHKANVLLEKVEHDARAAEQLQRRQKEMAKMPRYGQNQAMSYLQASCSEYEKMVAEFNETLSRVEGIISAKLNRDPNRNQITHEDLMSHLRRFDQVFKVIASDVYQCNQQVQDAKEALLEYRRRMMPYAPDPFEKKLDTVQNAIALSKFTGAEAFPSQVTMMKIGELAKAATSAQSSAAGGFGASGSLFGSKPLGSTPFSFSTPSTGTSAPMFKLFSTPSTSTSAPLFGSTTTSTAGVPPAAPTASSSFTFGNTLNSSVSGTLFGGSASKPLFGK
uniref:Nucleoporin p58/p45 n=1 Tax=Parascaris univalens TaxID=6257 RepID=A0A915BRG8_PARUN